MNIAEGAGYGTKSVLTSYLAGKSGLPPGSYTPVLLEKSGRQEAILEGLKAGQVDVVTSQEPLTAAVLATNLATALYDLNTRKSTTQVLGAAWPSQSLLLSPRYIEAHPDIVQRLVNAFVKTMRYVNSHSAQEIAAQLPPGYFDGKDRQAEIDLLAKMLPTYASGDYSFARADVEVLVDTIRSSTYDASEEGQWRATTDNAGFDVAELYTNEFVVRAMETIP
jgi:NitT/TauT family transport system substrate-binding protein